MAEEKKSKIDLKARLGKAPAAATPAPTPSGVPTPAIPPPMGSVPGIPAAPPAGIAPPFAQPQAAPSQPAPPPPPKVDASDPFGSIAASAARPAPAEIKIEVGDEVIAAQQRAGKKTFMLAGFTAIIGLVLGYAFGNRSAEAQGASRALEGAKELSADVEKSQAKIKELNEKLAAAVKSLGEKKFPESFSTELGGLSIPFGGDKLAGKNIGRFDPSTMRLLLTYAGDVEQLNARKDVLKNLFAGQKQAISDALAQAEKPKVNFGVLVQKTQDHGPVGVLAPIPAGQSWGFKDATWPAKFKINTGRELVDVDRYTAGDVVSNPPKVSVIPLEPDSVATAFPNDVVIKLQSELRKTMEQLGGKSGATPDEEDAGVLKEGDQLLNALKKIGAK
jgi:hypothetical protein